MKRLDITGQKFGRLTAIRFDGAERKHTFWIFKCSCGTIKRIGLSDVSYGRINSCGCIKSEIMSERGRKMLTTHGMASHPAYAAWRGIKFRCANPKAVGYKDYGGRGIGYDSRWEYFEVFWEEMGPSYVSGLEIDRKDNNGNYTKENCKWSTRKEQQNNRNCCVILEMGGMKMTVSQWAEKLNISKHTIYSRIRSSWSVERILTVPVKKYAL